MRKHIIVSDVKRSLCGRNFIISVMGMVLVIVLSSMESIIYMVRTPEPLQNGYHAQFVIDALMSDWITLSLPIICALPFTTAFVDDIKNGFIKQYLHRSGNTSYIMGKLIACGLSGGLTLLLGTLLAYGLSALVFIPMEIALGAGEAAHPYFVQLLVNAVMLFFSGVFWSLIGFAFAAFTMNKYMAYASPFIFYYVLIILNERYFSDLYVLHPKEWLFPSDAWAMGHFGVILLLVTLSAIVSFGFAVVAKRRLANV
jgi:hypothetical protein